MLNEAITLGQLLEVAGECDGRVTIVDPIYDETHDVTHFDTAHNLEMFFACIDGADNPEIAIEDVIEAPEDFDDIPYYGVYAYIDHSADFRDAVPVTDCAMSDGRLILFV